MRIPGTSSLNGFNICYFTGRTRYIINKVYQLDYRVHIEDRANNGTQVSIYLPVTKKS